MSGLGLTIPLLNSDGQPTRWEFPTFDGRVPAYIQRSFDYMGEPPCIRNWKRIDESQRLSTLLTSSC